MEYYEYKPITAKEHTFRLILLHPASQPQIEIDIIHASLDEENLIAYEAISYVWGTQEFGTSVFVPEVQKHLKVTNSLELVLRDLRLPDTKRCLWIDGICINQNDQNDIEKKEKNHQVRLMGRIYNSAHRVLFHLGRPTELTPILKDAITEMQQHQAPQETSKARTPQDLEQELDHKLQELQELQELPETTELQELKKTQELQEILDQMHERQVLHDPVEAQKPSPEATPETVQTDWGQVVQILSGRHHDFHTRIRQSVELVLQQPWFRRVWIVQEVANAREALIYWGPTELSVRYFMELARILRVKISTHQKAILDMMPPSRRKGLALSSGQDLYDLLVRFIGAEASKSHDKIFALLGMCKMGKGQGTLAIDYSKSLKSLVREAVAYMSFCDQSDVPDEFATMERLTAGIGSLLQELVFHFATGSKLLSLRSLLLNRGDQITITPRIIESTVKNHGTEEVFRLLLSHGTYTITVSLCSVREAITQGKQDAVDTLLTRLEEKSPCMAKRIRAAVSTTNGCSLGTQPRYTPLALAVIKGEADDIRQLLEGRANVYTDMYWHNIQTELEIKSMSKLLGSTLSFSSDAHGHEMAEPAENCLDGANFEVTDLRLGTALTLAVQNGRKKIVHILLDHGADIEAKSKYGRTPLSIAAGGGFDGAVSSRRFRLLKEFAPLASKRGQVYSALVQLFLDRGAEVNSADNSGQTPLWWAVDQGHGFAVEKLLANEAAIGTANDSGMSLLSRAIFSGDENIIAQLLANDALSMAHMDDYLESAIRAGNNPLLKELIDRCAMIYGGPFVVKGPLFAAAIEEGNADALQTLALHPMLLEGHSTLSHGLLLAASKGDFRCVEILLEIGSNADYADFEGNTPLSEAIRYGSSNMVQQLLNKNCSPNGSERHRYTPLTHAVREGHVDIAQLLLESHANVNARCKYKETALWEAAIGGHQEMVRLLLKYGADTDVCCGRGSTPLMRACRKGHTAVVQLLLDAKADVWIHDQDGYTALDWAKIGCQNGIVQILTAHRGFQTSPVM